MRRYRWNSFFLWTLATVICFAKAQANNCWTDKATENAKRQVCLMLEALEDSGQEGNPVTLKRNGEVFYCNCQDWRSGFFPGTLWQLYELTEDSALLLPAKKHTEKLEEAKRLTRHHDIGFIIGCSFGNGFRLARKKEYADVIVMRHPDDKEALQALNATEGYCAPVISGGYGHVTHPTQGLLDAYTCWRAFGDLSKVTVAIATPDLSRARSGHSFALTLAAMGAKIIYSGTSALPMPEVVRRKLTAMGAHFEEHFDLIKKENEMLYMDKKVDLIYLPGCSVKKDDPNRADFERKMANFYISLEMLKTIKEKTGKTVGLHHSLPRNPGEFDFNIDNTEHQLYFRAIGFSVALRMALLAAVVGVR